MFQIAFKPRPVKQPRQRIDVIKRDSVRSVGRRLSLKITQNKRDARMFLIAQPARNSQQPDPMICAVVLLLTVVHINLLLPTEKLLPQMRKSRQPQILRLIIRMDELLRNDEVVEQREMNRRVIRNRRKGNIRFDDL